MGKGTLDSRVLQLIGLGGLHGPSGGYLSADSFLRGSVNHLGFDGCIVGRPKNEDDLGLGDGGGFLPTKIGDDVTTVLFRNGLDEVLPLGFRV